MNDPRVLIADDDKELCELLKTFLGQEGFAVDAVFDGRSALERVASDEPDILILDVMMPRMSGIEVLRELRRTDQLPVLMLTARGDETDRIIGLELGADDYLPKPCNPRELAARLRAILRRSRSSNTGLPVLRVAGIELRPGSREVFFEGRALPLTSTEFTLLQCLMMQAGEVVPKTDLYRRVLGRDPVRYDRSIDMHVSNLRKKLSPDGSQRPGIETVRGLGYQLVVRS